MQFSFIFAALSLLVASPAQSSLFESAGATASAINPVHHGLAHGSFELPTPAGPGALHGRLFAPSGVALFAVHAHVSLGGAGTLDGRIDGVLVRLVGPSPGPVAEVHGPWSLGATQPGDFLLHVIIPGDPSTGIPPELIGRIEGRFLEPNGPLPPAGSFRAHWALRP